MQGNLENSLWLRGRWVSGKNHMIFIIIFIIWSLQYLSCLFANKINTLNHSNMSFYNENTKIILKYKLIGIIINNNLQKKKIELRTEFWNPTRWSTRLKAQVMGFDRVTGSCPGHPGKFFFFNSKRRCFDKKINGLQPGFWPGQLAKSTGLWLLLFFLKPNSILAPGRPARPDWPSFKSIIEKTSN